MWSAERETWDMESGNIYPSMRCNECKHWLCVVQARLPLSVTKLPLLKAATHLARYATCILSHSIRMQQLRHMKRVFSANLLLANTGTCCVLYTVGDLCQQKIEGREKVDWARTARMAILGFCLGPVNHYWYQSLDRFLPGTTIRLVAQKVLWDQTVMAPFCSSVFYIGEESCDFRSLVGWRI